MPSRSDSKRQTDFFDTCSQCRTNWSCCHETTPPVTDRRRKIIEDYLRAKSIRIGNPFVKAEYVFPRLVAGGYCVFHDEKTKKCLIHPVKPETCVAGPITFDIKAESSKIEWFIKMDKICQLAGCVHVDKALLQRHVESAKKEISRLVNELDSEALRAILKKEEPETFKIGEDNLEKSVLNKLTQYRQSDRPEWIPTR
jgi:Fe-S-cluster containining protein